jgi:hypothetical protein
MPGCRSGCAILRCLCFAIPPPTRNEPNSQHPPLSLFVTRFYIQLRTSRATKKHNDATISLFVPLFYIHFPLSPHAPSPPPLTLARGDGEVRDLLESMRTSRPGICLRENCKYSDDPHLLLLRTLALCSHRLRVWCEGTGKTNKATLLLPGDTLDTFGRFLGSVSGHVLVPA